MTNEREPRDPLPSRFEEDDDGAEIGSDGSDAAGSTDSALPGAYSPRRARREQDGLESAPTTSSATTPTPASSNPASSTPAPSSNTAPSRLASEAKFAWGLTPRVPVANDGAAGRSTAESDDAAASVEPGTPTENDVSREAPASSSRPFYPPPPVRSSDFDAPADPPKGVVTSASPNPAAPGDASLPQAATSEPATTDPAPTDPAASDLPPVDSSPLPIPTIQQVLDAPSPRRAAREAAAREEAARAAGDVQPTPPAPSDATSAPPSVDAGIPPLTEPVIATWRVRAPEIDPSAADLTGTERTTNVGAPAGPIPASEMNSPSVQPMETSGGSGLDVLFGTASSGPHFGDPDVDEGTATGAVEPAPETAAEKARGRRFAEAGEEAGEESESGAAKAPMATRQKVLIGVVILLLLVLVVVVLLAVGRISSTPAALGSTFDWATSMGLPPVWLHA